MVEKSSADYLNMSSPLKRGGSQFGYLFHDSSGTFTKFAESLLSSALSDRCYFSSYKRPVRGCYSHIVGNGLTSGQAGS